MNGKDGQLIMFVVLHIVNYFGEMVGVDVKKLLLKCGNYYMMNGF